ncbi:MAG: ABC-F family ATP-binding cassette domain-containing protein [Pseudomonadota bacterium]
MTNISLKDAGFLAHIPLFQNLTFTAGPGDRIGLVAQNGAGKSTLLRCIAGELELTSGDITRTRGSTIGYVAQDAGPELLQLSFRDAVLAALPPAVHQSDSWRVDVVLDGLETPSDIRDLPVSALSGGWQRLMLLARTWVKDPDALLLDEPTNYLDLEKILLLENWVDTWARDVPMIVASHDRSFLDAVTNRTLFLRPGSSVFLPLPYSQARQELAQMDQADAAGRERDLKQAGQLRRQSAKLKNIGVNSGSDLLLKKQKQLRERAERIEEAASALHRDRSAEIRLANRDTHARSLIRIDGLIVKTPDQRPLFTIDKLSVDRSDRMVILGRNGTGKSTLVRLLRDALEGKMDVPEVKVTPSLALGYMDQALTDVPGDLSPFDFLAGQGQSDARYRSALATAGIDFDKQSRPISVLSLGEKSRLALLALRFAEPNFYLLDEPTNHVDIAGQEALAEEIRSRQASCVLTSHDRAFVREVGTRFLVVENGSLNEFGSPGHYFASLEHAV